MVSAWWRLSAGQVTPGHTQPRWSQSMVSRSPSGARAAGPGPRRLPDRPGRGSRRSPLSAVTSDRRDRRNDDRPPHNSAVHRNAAAQPPPCRRRKSAFPRRPPLARCPITTACEFIHKALPRKRRVGPTGARRACRRLDGLSDRGGVSTGDRSLGAGAMRAGRIGVACSDQHTGRGSLGAGTVAISRHNSATCARYSSWYRSHSPR